MEITLTQAIADYIEQRKQAKLEPLKKALDKVLNKSDNAIEIAEAKAVYAETATPVEEKFKPEIWLTDAARRAEQISLATHAAKFTHSDSKSSSVLDVGVPDGGEQYLITSKLKNKTIDVVGNAAVFDVATLLRITVNSESLISQLQNDYIDALKPFSNNSELVCIWKKGFKRVFTNEKLSSHTSSKQLYFPVNSDNVPMSYHLLCPLFSSALNQELYDQVYATKFGNSKDIRDARKSEKYHAQIDQSFPLTAIQNFGGSQPQNISYLNKKSERGGKSYLLNAAPPRWKSQRKPPLKSKTIFNREFNFKVWTYLREFKVFLNNLGENERNFKVRYKREQKFVLPIIDVLFNSVVTIQLMQTDAGWSNDSECQLKNSHCLWLDVFNPNELFQQEREKGDWLLEISNDFSQWLIFQLKNEKYKLSDIEHNYFSKLFLHKLKHFERTTPKLGEL